jgi:tetraacyldisaccharide 4'-kinase
MMAPRFWDRAPGPAAFALAPLGALWALATRLRLRRPGTRVDVPVICVGNLTAGGAGKTPVALALAARLAAAGRKVHVLTRGHGGSLVGPVRVDLRRHGFREVGDEALLLAAVAPVQVARDRLAGARAAIAAGADILIMDDGFQNPALAKDLSLLVVDAEQGFGNGFCIPAGPLRERVADGLARADLIVPVGRPEAVAALLARWPMLRDRPLAPGEIRPLATGTDWRDRPVIAFAGIGRPEKFFATLRALGARIVAAHAFPDHAPYPDAILKRLAGEAEAAGAELVTTDKDAVRLPAWFRGRALPLPVAFAPCDWAPFDAALARLGAPQSP